MERSAEEVQSLMDHFDAELKRSGVRMTPQRTEIYREVARSLDHPDAEAIHRSIHPRMPSVSLDTVYRALCLFVDLGLVTNLAPPPHRMRYDANMAPHGHFVCTRCGLARDLDCDALDAMTAPDSAKAFGIVWSTHIEWRGLCSHCLEAQYLPREPEDTSQR